MITAGRSVRWMLLAAAPLVVAGCVAGTVDSSRQEPPASSTTTGHPPSTTATLGPTTTTAATTTSTSSTTTATTVPAFHAEILEIDEETAARMMFSWHEGCPVTLDQLRLLKISFHDFDGNARTGELIVDADVAGSVVVVFERLFDTEFPIERMELVDVYQGDDDASMRANNTSGFNCRYVTGTETWSEHAYGRAIDINPLLNPWIRGSSIDPAGSERYVDRTLEVPGMIHAGDTTMQAFAAIGWTWGGTWVHSKDYMHFSSTGR